MNWFKPSNPPPSKPKRKYTKKTRGYREVVAQNNLNSDWITSGLTEDSDIWTNIFALRARMRDLWKTNPYFSKYRELLASNIFGEAGIMLRMKVTETEDRVINTPDERNFYLARCRRRDRVFGHFARKAGREFFRSELDFMRDAIIKVGQPDLFVNMLIESKWARWQRAEHCDIHGRRHYSIGRQLRLWSCARDGDHFIRMVRDSSIKPFGFALQHINAEWCDYFLNVTLNNGNEIRMGIEYETRASGIGKPVAYHFIKRMPRDWMFSAPQGAAYSPLQYDRIPAEDIVHVARFTDQDGTRPAPWGASVIGKSRGLDQYELAEVFAARAAACKTGWAYSDMAPEGGGLVGNPDPAKAIRNLKVEPGGLYGLPWGIKIQEVDPTHPGQNFPAFRQGMLQSWCAGMPGADYNMVANDLANISFSSGRLGRLDTNEGCKIIQAWDICTSEQRIFENWLEAALMNGAIPLPLAKYSKFNKPVFQGRRWRQVDEVKEATAASLRIANALSSRSRECADTGQDWEEIAFELAEEQMLADELGLDIRPTTAPPEPNEPDADETQTPPQTKPAANGNGNGGAKPPKKTARASASDPFDS